MGARRAKLGWAALAAMTVALLAPVAPAAAQDESVEVRRGTNLAVSLSPDGRTLVMDLQGVLWRLPAAGGRGVRLTDDLDDPALPSWAPDGRRIVYESYRDGTYDLWTMRPDGRDKRRVTHGPFDDREPVYSPDGRSIAFSSDRGGSYDVWVLDLASGGLARRTDAPTEESQPTWSPDGREVAYVVGRAPDDPERAIGQLTRLTSRTIEASDAAGARRTLVTETAGAIASPSWGPEGDAIAYVVTAPNRSVLKVSGREITAGEDVFAFRPQWASPTELVYGADGRIKRRDLGSGAAREIPFSVRLDVARRAYERKDRARDDDLRSRPVRGIVSPVLAPDGQRIAFVALGDLWLMRRGGTPRRLTRDRAVESDPAWSPDGRRIAYVSDRAGSADLYVRAVASGTVRRVTSAPGGEVAPAFSPDGRTLAYQDEEDATFALDLASRKSRPLVPAAWEPGSPTWGPGGKTVAIAALRPYSNRFREGTSQILTVDAASGERSWVDPVPFASLSNRVTSGPVWSRDGRAMAFVLASRLWVMDVDERGRPTGAPRRVSEEVAESPSWGRGSRELLYQSNGRLRVVAAAGGTARTVPVALRWRPARAPRRQVIHAGALWDGVARKLRRNVDIVVRGTRIAEVRPHRGGERRRGVIDASELTVIPGLWDNHVHQELYRSVLGRRQGAQQLAFGVTTTVGMGDPAYHALEDREALASGRRVGPRFLMSGEPLDGSRVYYDFMRPVRTRAELERELDRVRALDYDILKTYVRLPYTFQARAIDVGHDLGLPSYSHYWYPPVAFGQDGISHITATQRLGFTRTQSPSGFAYEDVVRTATASRMAMISTLFSATVLLAEYPELLRDPRVRALYTPQQREELDEFGDEAGTPEAASTRLGLERSVGILRDILRGGGTVLAGTDLPLEPVAVHLHLNLRAMVRFGLTPYEALRTATSVPARHFGASRDLGTVRPGRLADLAFVQGDPLRRIEDAADVQMVMTNGRLRTVESLLADFPRE